MNTDPASHDQRHYSGSLSVWALLLMLVIVCATAWSTPREKPKPESGKQQTQPEQRGTENAPIFVKGEVTTKKDKGETDHDAEERKAKEETDASLVKYTGYLSLFTFLLFVFTAALWWVTFRLSQRAKEEGDRQAAAMGKSITEAVRSADAMEAVAEATKTNAFLMKEVVQKQARSYLGFESALCVPQDRLTNWRYEVRFHIKNFGHTSAQAVNVNSRLAVLDFPIPEGFDCRLDIDDQPGADFATQQAYYFAAPLDRLLSDEEIASIKRNDGKAMCLYGTVKYKDVYGDTHYTNFFKICRWDVKDHFSTQNAPWHNDTT